MVPYKRRQKFRHSLREAQLAKQKKGPLEKEEEVARGQPGGEVPVGEGSTATSAADAAVITAAGSGGKEAPVEESKKRKRKRKRKGATEEPSAPAAPSASMLVAGVVPSSLAAVPLVGAEGERPALPAAVLAATAGDERVITDIIEASKEKKREKKRLKASQVQFHYTHHVRSLFRSRCFASMISFFMLLLSF